MKKRFSKFFLKHKKAVLIVAGAIILVAVAFAVSYSYYNDKTVTADPIKASTPTASKTKTPTPAAAKKQIAKEPPKHTSSGGDVSTQENSDGSKTTTVTEGPVDAASASQAASAGSSGATPLSVHYIDNTGQYPDLGSELENYMNATLLWGGEISSLNAIIVQDAGDTGWTGLYSGSYNQDASGHITSAWGYITLNTYYYKNSPYFVDYEKLTLSHEYGHHYTLYHKWIDWQLTADTRFPDSYYSVRPLSKDTTAPDYSLGWGNCDAEIIAEDYSYLYSGYGYHAMAGTYGYPSAATKTWLVNEPAGGGSAPAPTAGPVTVTPSATTTSTATATNTAAVSDTQQPSVTISAPATNPYTWASGNLPISAVPTDNVSVTKVELYVNDDLAATQNGASISRTWMQNGTPAGSYTLKAKAYDTSGNTAETSITINKTF